MDAALSALIGAAVGASATLVSLLIQQHFQTKRERLKIASDLGLAEYQHDLKLAENAPDGGNVAPLATYVICNARLLDELAKGAITGDKVKALTKERDEILAAFPGAPT